MNDAYDSNRRLGEWRKFDSMPGIQIDRRSGLERRTGIDRRQPHIPTLWLRPERRNPGDRRRGPERRLGRERRSGEERRL